ncbi:unnamed protein product [Fusarium graminearum]|nr:hypothetical protein FG05_10691 [Fusarium graminearum]CAG1959019.1 unnamed protein product [Fusarium graminearum]CAG2010747.1 unnamed protein product [Fusarium graminearum]CZS79450.1 unnamed protein product [Fusarium graminearum]VTO94258.1 unnamed protein product [Fusarium graminearum]
MRRPHCSVFWDHADNETAFGQDYKIVAGKFSLDSKLDGEELLAAVRERIEAETRWLLILDNADDLALFGVDEKPNTSRKTTSLFEYIPRGPTGALLWTSRDERIAGTLVGPRRGIQVAQMTIDKATALLKTTRNKKTRPQEIADTRTLSKSFIGCPWRSLKQEHICGGHRRQLRKTEFDRHRRAEVPNSILETWSISIERIRQENEMAHQILHILAYLDNQGIPFELIATAATFGMRRQNGGWSTDQQQVDRAIVRLKEFSFLRTRRTESGERSFEMHKLVQEAARYGLIMRKFLQRKTTKH